MSAAGDRDRDADREGSDSPDRADHAGDRDAVDRAFADLVAGYHLTAERDELPPPPRPTGPGGSGGTGASGASGGSGADASPDSSWIDAHPLFRFETPPEPEPVEPEEHYEPPAPEPLPAPAWPVLLGWLGMGYAVLVVLAVVVGANLPSWAAWLGLIGFVGGFGILLLRLPRHRSPEDGDGAVL